MGKNSRNGLNRRPRIFPNAQFIDNFSSDVAYFDGLNETIISVGLVKPKPGIFQSYVKYLLILTTTVEISVLGVTFSETNDGNSISIDKLLMKLNSDDEL